MLPRAEAEQAIQEGRVEVDGRVERDPFAPVQAGSAVRVDGQPRPSELRQGLGFQGPA